MKLFNEEKVKIYHIRVVSCIIIQGKQNLLLILKKDIFYRIQQKKINNYIIMDYNNYSICYCREIHCLEDIPASLIKQ